VEPELRPDDLVARYARVREVRRCELEPRDVYVLSRITLGADVVVTSTILDALKRRFPNARIWFVGPGKNAALFQGIGHLEAPYARGGTLGERIGGWRELRAQLDRPDAIVVDPDSRLTQLGLLPVADEERYFFFESRAYGGESGESLAELTSCWVGEVFGIDDARPFVSPPEIEESFDVTVSFGVGENPEKRVGDEFERGLLEGLAGRAITVDMGAGVEEAERVRRATDGLSGVRTWQGAYAPFAAMIARSRLFAGYDSAGQHVAAAAGIPLVSIFAGHVSERMYERWRPTGSGPIETVKVVPGETAGSVLERAFAAVRRVISGSA
jgi:hypothetical protein